jgi:hypothetical protein
LQRSDHGFTARVRTHRSGGVDQGPLLLRRADDVDVLDLAARIAACGGALAAANELALSAASVAFRRDHGFVTHVHKE